MAKRSKPFKGITTEEFSHLRQVGQYTETDQFKFESKQAAFLRRFYASPDALRQYLDGDANLTMQLFSDGGHIKFVQPRLPSKQDTVHIDYLTFTAKAESYNLENIVTDDELILVASRVVKAIFGFGITERRANGAYFYRTSFELGDGYGLLCFGGQNDTLLVSVNGTGCAQASEGWQSRLLRFLETSIQPTITRIDLAHDVFDAPQYYVDFFLRRYDQGAFTTYRNPPKISQAGNWLTPDQKGRTLYIGSRTTGLYLRIYEKGKQLESADKPTWVRIEAELKSNDRIIPLDVLMRPHEYLAGTYPALRFIHHEATKIEKIRHEVRADFDHRVKWAKRQSGGFLHLLNELGYSPTQILDLLEGDEIPKPFRQKFLDNPHQSICEKQAPQSDIPFLPDLNLED